MLHAKIFLLTNQLKIFKIDILKIDDFCVQLLVNAQFCHQEKLVQEVMARQMPQPKLANTLSGALYPGFAMPIYAPSAAAMAPIMHVIPPQQVAPPSPVRSEETQPSSYVQQLQSK